jgi:MFS family permease
MEAEEPAMSFELEEDVRLLKNPRFRRLLEARILGQTGHNAMLYALLILVVEETNSSIQSTLLIVAFTLPAVFFGIPAGTVADMLPKRLTLTMGYLLRAAIAGALVYYSGDVVTIYLLAAAASLVIQFFSPAEFATVPAIVRSDQLPAANSLMVFTLILGQVAGMVVIAPVLIKLVSPEAVFASSALLFLAATYIIAWLAAGFTRAEEERPSPGFLEATRVGFRILRSNRHAYLAVIYLTTTVALSKVLVVLLPRYTADVLQIKPEDAVFAAAPAAIGAGAGLLLTPALTRLIGAWRTAALGFALFLLAMMGLGLVVYVRDFIQENFDFGISFIEDRFGLASVITVTMLLAIPLGFAFTAVAVAGRSVLNEQAPQEAQGRVFAVQLALGDFFSLLPLLLVGAVAEFVGVRATLLASAVSAMGAASYLTFSKRFGPRVPDLDQERVLTPGPGPAG